MVKNQSTTASRPVSESLREYFRGIAGGFLFSLPLLFTNEMWRSGAVAEPQVLLAAMIFTMGLLLAYNQFAGIRHDKSWHDVVIDSIEEFGLGVLLSAFLLWAIGQIDRSTELYEATCTILTEAMVAAIGVSVGTAQLGLSAEPQKNHKSDKNEKPGKVTLTQTTIAVCGAFLVGMNVGPTDEIPQIAATSTYGKILVIGLFTFLIGCITLYYSDFRGAHKIVPRDGFRSVLLGSVFSYLIALVTAFLILLFFGRIQESGLAFALSQVVVLGFATNLGASAGRLILQWD